MVTADGAGGTNECAAEVRPCIEARLGFRVGGRMVCRTVDIGHDIGQRVRAGQVLAQRDRSDTAARTFLLLDKASTRGDLHAVAVGGADANSVVVEARKPGARLMLAAWFRVKRV